MQSFQHIDIWRRTLAEQEGDDRDKAARDRLRVSFRDLRERAAALVGQIPPDIPGLTVHDITHLDALWETASLIAGDNYELTPAEGYVLGGAILLHDAAMTLAAFPGGLADLRKTDEWRDSVALILNGQSDTPVSVDMIEEPTDDIVRKAVPAVLRALHAKRSEQLPITAWAGPDRDASPEYLIQDSELRADYGSLIGKVAASHWWDVSELVNLPHICNAGHGIPSSWCVDPQKVACILRVADAAHIDHRRAPRWLRTLTSPAGESACHWAFQARLGKPSYENDALVYTSGSEFPVEEADAWWVCFDTVQMVDRELHGVDEFLEESGRRRFKLNHVKAAESSTSLACLIRTARWRPVDSRLRVSNVPGLVATLGGRRLYGDVPRVALRELIQNAADSVRAMRCTPQIREDYRIIHVVLRERSDGFWLDVCDNGVGMSAGVMTGTLLDFGSSLWRSSSMQHEHPGLAGRGLNASGRLGIGFFSVFMLGEHVKVTSCRYDAAQADTRTLEFRLGLASRPVLREPTLDEGLVGRGTRVSVRLLKAPEDEGGLLSLSSAGDNRSTVELGSLVASLCPSLDVSVEVSVASEERCSVIKAYDWRRLHSDRFLTRISAGDFFAHGRPNLALADNLLELSDQQGVVYGRACIDAEYRWVRPSTGVVTIDGLRSAALTHIGGVLFGGEPETVARNAALPLVPLPVLAEWATEQARLLCESNLYVGSKVRNASVVLALGGDIGELPLALMGEERESRLLESNDNGGMNASDLKKLLRLKREVRVFKGLNVEYDEDRDDMHSRIFQDGFSPEPDLLLLEDEPPRILAIGNQQWPQCLPGYSALPGPHTPFDAFCRLVQEVWGEEADQYDEESRVGSVHDFYEIFREVIVFMRPVRVDRSLGKKLRGVKLGGDVGKN